MRYVIQLTDDAEEDIERIGEYIAEADSPERAANVIASIREVVEGLRDFPERGRRVEQLVDSGKPDYREVQFKPYRIIYRVAEGIVHVHLIADGRRNLRTLLLRRLLTT